MDSTEKFGNESPETSPRKLLRRDGRVVTTEAEGVVNDGVHRHLARGVRDVIQIALGVGILQIDGRRDDAVFDGENAHGGFHRAGGAEHVAGCALGGTHDEFLRVVAENGFDRLDVYKRQSCDHRSRRSC